MSHTTAFAVYATSVAMLGDEDDEVLRELVELAEGDPGRLHDARALLLTIDAEPRQAARADERLRRAIHHLSTLTAPPTRPR